MATAGQKGDAREAGRHAKYLQVQFRPPVGRSVAARVSEVSEDGFRLLTTIGLTVGLRLWIKLPNLESRQAEVVWSSDGEAGCRFIDPLHPAVIGLLVQRNRLRLH